jgi:hypothetical protein
MTVDYKELADIRLPARRPQRAQPTRSPARDRRSGHGSSVEHR